MGLLTREKCRSIFHLIYFMRTAIESPMKFHAKHDANAFGLEGSVVGRQWTSLFEPSNGPVQQRDTATRPQTEQPIQSGTKAGKEPGRWKRAARGGTAVLAATSVIMVGGTGVGTAEASERGKTVTVDAAGVDTPTGIFVHPRQSITITAEGSWTVDKNNEGNAGPEGYGPVADARIDNRMGNSNPCKIVQRLPNGMLMARIDDGDGNVFDDPVYAVGTGNTITAVIPGEVMLFPHDRRDAGLDCRSHDNAGSVTATIFTRN
jgi:hypothetical protein